LSKVRDTAILKLMRDEVYQKIKAVLDKDYQFSVTDSEKPEFGDYSSNVAFALAKDFRKPPFEVAKELAAQIKNKDVEKFFSKVEAAQPGFINFWISNGALYSQLSKAVKAKKPLVPKRLKINVEFISANPTGPLTMANGRGGFWGDVLARVLEFAGHKVVREYYINDTGNQIKILGESILAVLGKASAREEHYQGDYVKDLAKQPEKKAKNILDPERVGKLAANLLLKQIKNSVKRAGIQFDVWFSEYQNLHKKGELKKVLENLKRRQLIVEKEGAIWLKSGGITDEKDRVLVKSDGVPTYFLADLAYHYDKFVKRKFDRAIDIWGADHHDYVARLKTGVQALRINPENLHIIITQLVRLIENGKEARMSKRKGEFVTLDELIEEVGVDAARFFFLTHTPETHMDFDLSLAKERSLKNPVYYVQYALVRCSSILEKARFKNKKSDLRLLVGDSELKLIKQLVRFPDVVSQTASDYQVNRLTRYTADIARALHNFYEKERVLGSEEKITRARLSLISTTKIILEKLFGLLGISVPKEM